MGYPDWYYPWCDWYLNTEREKSERPEAAPEKIPQWAWDACQEDERIAKRHGMTDGERDWIPWYLDGKRGSAPGGARENPAPLVG